ncbi:Hpt domain-containing protein [Vibrio metoecus]|uniref:Hpt domain-containing protein n=1 Tax=Vibrio metoecus TaxID=1481663 RepID=UPI0012AD64F1|nr:Hpt domain-containing protein [Vibrio metoecus]
MEKILSNKRLRNNAVMTIFVVWGIVAGLMLWQFHQISSSSRSLDELTNRLMHFRDTLYFSQPYRANQAPDLELELSLLLALRMQIEAEQSHVWFAGDVQQLLYQTDRFIEQARAFLNIELHPTELAELLRQNRQRVQQNDARLAEYFQLGALSFEALFADHRTNPDIYRSLDRLLKNSLSLPNEEQEHLQIALAYVSKLLTQYAEGDNIANKLLNHAVYEEASLLEEEYHHQLWSMMIILVFGTVLAMLSFMLLLSCRSFSVLPTRTHEEQECSSIGGASSQVNIEQLKQALNGNIKSVHQLLNVFLEDHKQDDERIRAHIVSDAQMAQRVSHSLKSAAASLGAERLKNAAAEIEGALQAGKMPSEQVLDNLSSYLAKTVREVEWHMARLHLESYSSL